MTTFIKTYSPDAHLSVVEHKKLGINRTYFISKLAGVEKRGGHAHKECKQYVYPISGHCDITIDNGYEKETYRLRPERGLFLVDNLIWSELYNFSDDCLLAVFATHPYKEKDYIRDYDEFIDLVENEEWMHAIK